jgi:hypothetical protein
MGYRRKLVTREDLEVEMAEHQSPYKTSMVEVGDGGWQL